MLCIVFGMGLSKAKVLLHGKCVLCVAAHHNVGPSHVALVKLVNSGNT